MLEYGKLLIQECDQKGRISILGGSPLQEVGFAQTVKPQSLLARLLFKPRLAVHESGDEPLVFTLRQGWSLASFQGWREVDEAEDQRIGFVSSFAIRLDESTTWATIQKENSRKTRITRGDTSPLAELEFDSQGIWLHFGFEVQNEPYLKMLLLAVVLLWPRNRLSSS